MESLDASLEKDVPRSYRALRGASVSPYHQAGFFFDALANETCTSPPYPPSPPFSPPSPLPPPMGVSSFMVLSAMPSLLAPTASLAPSQKKC